MRGLAWQGAAGSTRQYRTRANADVLRDLQDRV